jgi:hypothetical protein
LKYFLPLGNTLIKVGLEDYIASAEEIVIFKHSRAFGVSANYLYHIRLGGVPLNVPREAAAFGANSEVFVEVYHIIFSHISP